MKNPIPQEQRAKTISNIIVVAAGMGMLALLIYFKNIWSAVSTVMNILSPFFLGFALAFLQNPILKRVEWAFSKTLFRKKAHPKISRALGATISLLFVLAVIAAFLLILVPQMIDSISSIVQYISTFVQKNADQISSLLLQYDLMIVEGEELVLAWNNIYSSIMSFLSKTSDLIPTLLEYLKDISKTAYQLVFQLFVGLITAFYLLIDKERGCAQTKKICYSILKPDTCERLIYWTRRANRIFAGFISGKILDSIIIGFLCYFGMLLFRIEYPLLISVIVGITNVLPFFGPFIGAIPSILILLIINPYSALWFALFVLVLQQLDGNIIGPLILGDYVGISPLWIMISIVVGGGLFGFVGMLMSVPVFALVYAIINTAVENRLKARGLPVHSDSYIHAPEKIGDGNAEN